MPGTSNDVIFAGNFDFSGGFPVTGQMLLDGQLLIGSTALNAGGTHCNINTLTAGTGISITNGPGTITITNTGGGGGGGGTTSLAGNSGSATQVGGVINVVGGTNLTTTGAGQTLTITPTGNLLALAGLSGTGYVVQTGVNTFAERTFVAGSGITLTNADGVAGATTITAGATVPTTFTEDAGSATPAANNINILGTAAQGISTSGAGSTVTLTASNASSTQKGVAKFDATNFTVTAGNVTSNAITVTAGTGLSTGGSVNLGGSVTLNLTVPVTVPNGGTGQTSFTAHGVVLGEGASALGLSNIGTNGQVLIGGTGVDPAFATVGGTQGVTLTTGSNTLSIGLVSVPNSALANSSITVAAGAGISVAGSPVSLGGTVTISATGTIVTQFSADVGVATPSGNNVNLLGTATQGISTSASGATVTFTVADATTTTKGVASFNTSDFTVSSGAVSLNTTTLLKTLTPDVGGAVSPTAENINIIGYDTGSFNLMDTHNTGSSTIKIENRTWLTPLVVDPSTTVGARGTFSTIGAAITAASSGQDIFIRPGTYTEDLTLKAGVNLTAFTGDELTPNVTIIGKCSFSGAGTVTISNIRLQTNSDNFLAVTGSSASVVNIENCYLNCTNNTGISYTTSSSSSTVIITKCRGDIGTTGIALFTQSSTGRLLLEYCDITNSGVSSTASSSSAGITDYHFSYLEVPFSNTTPNVFTTRIVHMNTSAMPATALSIASSGQNVARNSTFTSSSASTISIDGFLRLSCCCIGSTNTNAIIGAGELRYSALSFSDAGHGVTTTTQSTTALGPRLFVGGNCEILSGAGSPSGSVTAPKGSLYLRTDGTTTNNRAFINTNGGTTWTAITTVA